MDRLPRALALARRSYPAVIADLPPGLYSSALEVSKRADEIYLVCTPEVTSLHLARRRINDLLRNDVDKARIRVVLNRCGSYRALPQSDVEQVLGIEVHHSISNDYEAVTAADMAGGLVSSESRLGHDLKALARRVAGTEPEQSPPTSNWKRLLRIG
jgi:Flp pilus assembly CpaE family ATPase